MPASNTITRPTNREIWLFTQTRDDLPPNVLPTEVGFADTRQGVIKGLLEMAEMSPNQVASLGSKTWHEDPLELCEILGAVTGRQLDACLYRINPERWEALFGG